MEEALASAITSRDGAERTAGQSKSLTAHEFAEKERLCYSARRRR